MGDVQLLTFPFNGTYMLKAHAPIDSKLTKYVN